MENNISKVKMNKECCGCFACFNICPTNAITMEENQEGFKEPIIDESKCTKCGMCYNTCPILNSKNNNNLRPEVYACMADDNIRIKSTSGGIFTLLAYEFLKLGGYVSGAVFFDDYSVHHIVSNKIEDIEKMRKSKYVQSNIDFCYKEIKQLLNNNNLVLFSGTPCQVAGLKSYLKKDYEKLYCLDLVCHGVPSPKVFRKYIKEEVLAENNEIWLNTDFRDKANGWGRGIVTMSTKTNLNTKYSGKEDIFRQLFSKTLSMRNTCGSCKFAKIPRQGDITIGDYWGVKKRYDDKKGTSVCIINNDKGNYLLKLLKKKSKLIKETTFEQAVKYNPNIIRSTHIKNIRQTFFKNLDTMSLRENLEKINSNKCDCMIINFWYASNYGASLTCLGVQSLVEKLGKTAKIINYIPEFSKILLYEKSFSKSFANKYLNLTTPCKTYTDFINLNKDCTTFITGSDQVFAPEIIRKHHTNLAKSIFLLDFVSNNNRKLS